jgi:hypothetical protein
MRFYSMLIAFLMLSTQGFSQTDTLDVPPPPPAPPAVDEPFEYMPWSENNEDDEDPNLASSVGFGYIGFGVILPMDAQDSLQIAPNKFSSTFHIHFGKKFRVGDHFGVGYTLGYTYNNYKLKQDSLNLLTGATEYDRLELHLDKISFDPFLRLIASKPNGKRGTYIDLGASVSWVVGRRLFVYDKVDPKLNNGASVLESNARKLQYVTPYDAYGLVRLGHNALAITAKYRLTDMFQKHEGVNNNRLLPNLSPLQVGLELVF